MHKPIHTHAASCHIGIDGNLILNQHLRYFWDVELSVNCQCNQWKTVYFCYAYPWDHGWYIGFESRKCATYKNDEMT